MIKQVLRKLSFVGLCWLLAACGSAVGQSPGTSAEQAGTSVVDPGLMARAVAEATTFVQQAEATSAASQGRAPAALAQEPDVVTATLPTPEVAPVVVQNETPSVPGQAVPATATAGAASITPIDTEVAATVLGVDLAAEGSMIVVRFLAPPAEAETWGPGKVMVTDENSRKVYSDIPTMSGIGSLIGRPKLSGQVGYVVLANPAPGLEPGALVAVVLGAHTFAHVTVQ
jgi:hypothetical protein